MINDDILYDWAQDKMIEIQLNQSDDFLKIKETLTRIGIASKKEKKLYQSCHILHKRGRYYIVHFLDFSNFLLYWRNFSIFMFLRSFKKYHQASVQFVLPL